MELTEAFLLRSINQGNTVIIIKKESNEIEDSFKDIILKKKKGLGTSSVPSPTPG